MVSPFKTPFEIKIVETGPLPLSIFDSITTPLALLLNEAFKSKISACSKIFSFSLSKLVFLGMTPLQRAHLHLNPPLLTHISLVHF